MQLLFAVCLALALVGIASSQQAATRGTEPRTTTRSTRTRPETAPRTEAATPRKSAAEDGPSCFVVSSYWPYKTCEEKRSQEICGRGWGAWRTEDICCSPGVAFAEGCTSRPDECWVVENFNTKTCIRDDRKCLQGFGVYPSEEACCAPNAAFSEGCRELEPSAEPCWTVDTYFPARQCRQSNTLCNKPEAGVQTFETEQECCAPGQAFSEGCSPPPPVPCWLKDEHYPSRTCTLSDDIAQCNRGWGIYVSKEVCCSPNVAFQEGCTPDAEEEVMSASGGL